MGIELYREFIVFSRFLNVTRAAEELHLSPSTLSRHLSALEAEVGGELFSHEGSGLALTPVGSVVLRGSSTIVADYQAMTEHVAHLKAEQANVVRVAFALDDRTMIDGVSLAKARLKQTCGNLGVQVKRTRGKSSLEALADGDVDVVVDYHFDASRGQGVGVGLEPARALAGSDTDLVVVPLMEDSIVFALPRGAVEPGLPVRADEICTRFIPWPSAAVDNYLDQVLSFFEGCRHVPSVRFIDAATMDEFFLHTLDEDEMWPFSRRQHENYPGSIPRSYQQSCTIHELADRDTTFRRCAVYRRDTPNRLVERFVAELAAVE